MSGEREGHIQSLREHLTQEERLKVGLEDEMKKINNRCSLLEEDVHEFEKKEEVERRREQMEKDVRERFEYEAKGRNL